MSSPKSMKRSNPTPMEKGMGAECLHRGMFLLAEDLKTSSPRDLKKSPLRKIEQPNRSKKVKHDYEYHERCGGFHAFLP
jgi:hypothetical protein